jgi:hypothetical protein
MIDIPVVECAKALLQLEAVHRRESEIHSVSINVHRHPRA